MTPSDRALALRFVSAINGQDTEALSELMPENHVFVDSAGEAVRGREAILAAWARFFRMFPDYQMEVHRILEEDGSVGIFGTAGGTWSPDGILREEDHWEIPAAWEANIRDGQVSVWRVFADLEPVRRIVGGSETHGGKGAMMENDQGIREGAD